LQYKALSTFYIIEKVEPNIMSRARCKETLNLQEGKMFQLTIS